LDLASPPDVTQLQQAWSATFDERKARVVELRHFGGLSVEETGNATPEPQHEP
jgi:hypothetical protein